MARHYHPDPARVRVVPRGIDLDRFDPVRVSGQRMVQLSERWRLPDGAPVVLLPGRLTRWKGHKVLIEALALIDRSDVRCLLVGNHQGRRGYHRELQRQINDRGLDRIVHLVEHCDDMPAAYMLADVVVSASLDPEAFGRVAVEAQAMGRPTIATDHGGARETLVAGETGWLTPPGDVGALAARAIERARAKFSKDVMCAATLAVYRELLDETAAAGRAAE